MIETLLEPFRYDFMRQAMLLGVIIAVPGALLSCFLVLRSWSLMGDAISHAVLPGIVLAYITGIPLVVGAFVTGLASSTLIAWLDEHTRLKRDTIMGVVFSAFFALGIVLFTKIETEVHLDHILFGNILGVLQADMVNSAIIALLITAFIAAKWRDLRLLCFDEVQTHASGLARRTMHYSLLIMLSMMVVATLKAVGIILSIALMITPGAIGFLVSRRFSVMIVVAVAVTIGSALMGIYLSFFFDSAPAPGIVLCLSIVFLLAFGRKRLLENSRKTVHD